jgi:MOSC domain-containing protein YiiM
VGIVERIFVAPSRGAPMLDLREVEAVAAEGLKGDRYLDPAIRRSPDYQITLIEAENIEAFTGATGLPMSLAMPRRNIVTRHVNLTALVGTRFRVGQATLEGLELCEPCSLFARRTHKEVLKFFLGRGGLRAAIIVGGVLAVGDTIGGDA